VVKDQPAGAKGAPVLAVGGKGRGITQGFPQELWISANDLWLLVGKDVNQPRMIPMKMRLFESVLKQREVF
jgi:hypothetical protein